MYNYQINIEDRDGGKRTVSEDGSDPGNALARCQKANPGAIMRGIMRIQHSTGNKIVYDVPPVQRSPIPEPKPCRPPKADERDGIMPFYDSVVRASANPY